jgi:hypothetical protein
MFFAGYFQGGENKSNACNFSFQNLLSSRLVSKNVNVIIYKTTILPVVLYRYKSWFLTLKEEHRLRMFENSAEEEIF